MGFCRRCGDIVSGERCKKCGGMAVGPSAPSINFSQTTSDRDTSDSWSRAYIRPNPPARDRATTLPSGTRPLSSRYNVDLSTPPSTTTQVRERKQSTPPISSTSKPSYQSAIKPEKTQSYASEFPEGDILSDPYTSTLSKAYGSVLQPKESLTTFSCFNCAAPFPPDATIYPDPSDPTTSTRFLCKPCFTTNGGSKGDCTACGRPVLILASEGSFVQNADRLWHKRCFRCEGCFKEISEHPIVDLLGRPTCEDCFDTCLSRSRRNSLSPKRTFDSKDDRETPSNLGGMQGKSRESSPAIDELHQRLGIKRRETNESELNKPTSTTREVLSNDVFKAPEAGSKGRYERFRMGSPKIFNKPPRTDLNGSTMTEQNRFRESFGTSPSKRPVSPTISSTSKESLTLSSLPDLTDNSDSNTTSSSPSTPLLESTPRHMVSNKEASMKSGRAEKAKELDKSVLSSPSTPCAKCSLPLFKSRSGGKFVTVPEESAKHLPPKSFHVECFRCAVCDDPFEETKAGQAIFVRSSTGCCHVSCATPERIVIRPLKTKSPSIALPSSLHKQEKPPVTAPPDVIAFPRFGAGGTTCPGCRASVSPMERGVVPGPQGSRWHASCLVCGGKGALTRRRFDSNIPGCGKRLDSAAKTDGDGGVWCRECLMLIPSSPIDSMPQPLKASLTGTTNSPMQRFPTSASARNEGIAAQFTGTTTIARQFTGMGALTSQLTGGGLSPTRQLASRSSSPTKMMSMSGGFEGRRIPFPRPKSVIGVRGKSVDEGRGMFLVRQFTGNGPAV